MLILADADANELSAITNAWVSWDMRRHAPDLARLLLHTEERAQPVSDALALIGTPECVPILLSGLPATAEERRKADHLLRRSSGRVDLRRCKAIVRALGRIRDPRAAPLLLTYFNSYDAQDNGTLTYSLWEDVTAALGTIGTEEAVLALESAIASERRESCRAWLREKLLPGLMRSRHPKGRAAIAEVLDGKNKSLQYEAVQALVETATPEDAALVLRVVADPNPLFTQQALRVAPRLLPGSRAEVEAGYSRAMAAGRPRTALALAEALGDAARKKQAQRALEKLRKRIWARPRIDRWLGMKKAQLKREFPQAEVRDKGGIALVDMQSRRAYTWLIDAGRTAGLAFRTEVFGDGPCQVIEVYPRCKDPILGVRIGDPASLAWELHGETEAYHEELWYRLERPGGSALSLVYRYRDNAVTQAKVKAED
ncbi:MAG: hypothetical protein JXR37_15175 [Kiritimatiellae bacterium]|nr:hypothetical protein [Kiritimatiellia bacterium]